MKVLPYVESIYDMSTDELKKLKRDIQFEVSRGPNRAELPEGVDTFNKFLRKTQKLKDCIDSELDERGKVDNVINFFSEKSSAKFLQEDFYEPNYIKSYNKQLKSSNPPVLQDQQIITTPASKFKAGTAVKQQISGGLQQKREHATTTLKLHQNMRQTQDEIDPNHILDDIQSNYNQSQANATNMNIGAGLVRQTSNFQRSQESLSEARAVAPAQDGQSMFGNRAQIARKDLASFMKEKLSQTKLSDHVAIKSTQEKPPKQNYHSQRPSPAPKHLVPIATRKSPHLEKSGSRSKLGDFRSQKSGDLNVNQEDDLISLQQANSLINKSIRNQQQYDTGVGVGAKSYLSREEHKVIIDPTKKVYKPLFNLPGKEGKDGKEQKPETTKASPAAPTSKTPSSLKTIDAAKAEPTVLPELNKRKNSVQPPNTVKTAQNGKLSKVLPKNQSSAALLKSQPKGMQKPPPQQKPQSRDSHTSSQRQITSIHDLLLQRAEENGDFINNQTANFNESPRPQLDIQTVAVSIPKPKTGKSPRQDQPAQQSKKKDENQGKMEISDDDSDAGFYSFDGGDMPDLNQGSNSKFVNLDTMPSGFQDEGEELLKTMVELKLKLSPESQEEAQVATELLLKQRQKELDNLQVDFADEAIQPQQNQKSAKGGKSKVTVVKGSAAKKPVVTVAAKDIQRDTSSKRALPPLVMSKESSQQDQPSSFPTPSSVLSTLQTPLASITEVVPKNHPKHQSRNQTQLKQEQQTSNSAFGRKSNSLATPGALKDFDTITSSTGGQQQIQALQRGSGSQVVLPSIQPGSIRLKVQRHIVIDEARDYGHLYGSFYDIFAGHQVQQSAFDIQTVVAEVRNMFAMFVLLMNGVQFANQDQTNQSGDFERQALMQIQVRDRFNALKSKEPAYLVKECLKLDSESQGLLQYRVIKQKSDLNEVILTEFRAKSLVWHELPKGLDLKSTWSLLWSSMRVSSDLHKLLAFQKVNFFVNDKQITRKDYLKRNIERVQRLGPKQSQAFHFMPLTFILPKEYVEFLTVFSELEETEGAANYWTMKAADKQRGQKLRLINDVTQVKYGEAYLTQQYVKNPCLVQGYKFDLRVYVLVTSVNPLEAFLWREGFAQFGNKPFSRNFEEQAHLAGQKVSLETLKQHLASHGEPESSESDVWDSKIWPRVRSTCLKALICGQPDMQYNPCCFDLYGFDLLLDQDLKPWLLEITSSPSLACDTQSEDYLKHKLISDSIDLLQPLVFDKRRLVEVLDRRLNESSQGEKNQSHKRQMNKDLTYVMHGQMPRSYGERPQAMGLYESIAPGQEADELFKLVGGQKMFGSQSKIPVKVASDVKGIGSLPQKVVVPEQQGSKLQNQRRQQPSQAKQQVKPSQE